MGCKAHSTRPGPLGTVSPWDSDVVSGGECLLGCCELARPLALVFPEHPVGGLIYALNASKVALEGEGRIDGRGETMPMP